MTKYLSNVIVSGFTVGAGILIAYYLNKSNTIRIYLCTCKNYSYFLVYHIVASQINVLLGIKLGSTVKIPFALTAVNI